MLAKSLINKLSARKRKSISPKLQFAAELPQSCSEPERIVQFMEKCQHCPYCFNNSKENTKYFAY